MVQAVDFTTLTAICAELKKTCVPAKVEQVIQNDTFSIQLILRTLTGKHFLLLNWHPQFARIHLTTPPPTQPSSFVFGQQVAQKIKGLALVEVKFLGEWERIIVLHFAVRPQAPILWRIYLEVMGKYSNAFLINEQNIVVSLAHQVNDRQSKIRPIGTGDVYTPPPPLLLAIPTLNESFQAWHDRLALIPRSIKDSLWKVYRGISPNIAESLLLNAGIDLNKNNQELTIAEWQSLFQVWQKWIGALQTNNWQITVKNKNYYLVPSPEVSFNSLHINHFIDQFYSSRETQQEHQQLHHKIEQVITNKLRKLQQKLEDFQQRIEQSDRAEIYRHQADLLSAYAHLWQAGMNSITLPDFDGQTMVTIPLDLTLNAFQNAEQLYKKHQKQKRTRSAIQPLIESTKQEILYLESIQTALESSPDYELLKEIEQELVSEGYLINQYHRPVKQKNSQEINCYRFTSPSNFSIWVGRNNLQNEALAFRIAGDYDLWFHAQEIAGSHVLLRLQAGDIPSETDMQMCADLASYFSKAKLSDRVPVVYTKPKFLKRPRGAKLGMVIYQQERVMWGCPQSVIPLINQS